jgi:hypothetical protein
MHDAEGICNRSRVPRVNDTYASGSEVGYISGNNRHSVNNGRGSDQRVSIGTRGWDMKRGASLRGGRIDRKDASIKCGQYMILHPGSKNCALRAVAPFDQ